MVSTQNQVVSFEETPEQQIAKLQVAGNAIVKLEEGSAMDTIAYV
jgi:chromosome segregation ATPase